MTMKQVIPIFIIFLFGQLAFAAPDGRHQKVTVYDYHDFSNSNIQSKTFNRYQSGTVHVEVWSFDRSVAGQVTRTEITSIPGSDPVEYVRCMINIFYPTALAFNWVQNNYCDPYYDPPTTLVTQEYDPLVPTLTSAMIPGVAWGSGSVMTVTPGSEQYYDDKNEVLGVEDISVPAGNFTGCLKIHRLRQVSSNPYTRIDWICPDMGLVKRVQGGRRMMELIDVTFTQ